MKEGDNVTINDRFKELRKTFGLSQEDLGSKIGISKSGISNIESGTRNVTDKHIKLICSELPVNEEWLRYGIGEPIRDTPSSTMEQLRKEFSLDDFSYNLTYEYLKLGQEQRELFRDFLYRVLNSDKAMQQAPETNPDDLTIADAEAEYKKSFSASAHRKESPASSTTDGTAGDKKASKI